MLKYSFLLVVASENSFNISSFLIVLVYKRCLLKAFNFCKYYTKQITGARKCNLNRYLIWVSERRLWIIWITRQQYWRSQDLHSALVLMDNVFSKLESFKLSCYLPISGNYHLNNLSRLSGLIRKFALFHVTGCLFPRKSRKNDPHCSCMNLSFLFMYFFSVKVFFHRHRVAGEGRKPSFIPHYDFHQLTNIEVFICNFACETTITYF